MLVAQSLLHKYSNSVKGVTRIWILTEFRFHWHLRLNWETPFGGRKERSRRSSIQLAAGTLSHQHSVPAKWKSTRQAAIFAGSHCATFPATTAEV